MAPLPAGFLREIANDRAQDYWQSIDDPAHRSAWRTHRYNKAEFGKRLMLKHYAARYGLSTRQADRDWRALQQDEVSPIIADRFCIFLGIHPTAIWPEQWLI